LGIAQSLDSTESQSEKRSDFHYDKQTQKKSSFKKKKINNL
jgi:hypothetical protein